MHHIDYDVLTENEKNVPATRITMMLSLDELASGLSHSWKSEESTSLRAEGRPRVGVASRKDERVSRYVILEYVVRGYVCLVVE
ncbi:hypothetical protein M413DRAFT_438994 [Hebeloma cylindrosporum]|uniref:Uncharacterized protein n=1 Tax=Hebeloma cylindrosporum TaxID=76867 RepID=A0A0C2Z9P4_HEBCY|nr:hypothetical protein M413DRAFT_438994 [Hebeloma cylindrosporum h7]